MIAETDRATASEEADHAVLSYMDLGVSLHSRNLCKLEMADTMLIFTAIYLH